jgi:hypothetical protein
MTTSDQVPPRLVRSQNIRRMTTINAKAHQLPFDLILSRTT